MHQDVRRTLLSLSASYALAWATVSMVAGPGSAALVALTGHLSHAGLFIALFYVAAALGAAAFGRAMDRFGRKPGLVSAHLLAAVGYAVAGAGVSMTHLNVFLGGSFLLAFGFGGVNLSRVAAAEIFPPAARGFGVGRVQVSATIGAIVGPLFLILSSPLGALLGRSPLTLVWFFAPPLLLVAAWVVTRGIEPMHIARDLARYHPEQVGLPPPEAVPAGWGVRAGGVVALAASQASMAAVMGVAGAAVAHTGHGIQVLGVLMFLHFVGMFGLSRVVGRTADRLGRRVTILLGLAVLAAGGAVTALVDTVYGFGLGLLLVGFGWSFGFIGATVLLADVTAPVRRARVLGRADLIAQLSAAVVAMAGGLWYAVNGMPGLGVLAIVVVAAPLVWMAVVREPRAAPELPLPPAAE